MKIYFMQHAEDGPIEKMVAFISDAGEEPENVIASFELAEDDSKLANRYSLKDGKLVDDYPDDDDEAVCVKEQEAEAAKAAALEAELSGE